MTLHSQSTPRWLFLVCTGLLLCGLVSCAPPAPPCKNDGECPNATPRCISGVCRECKGAEDCASQKCLSNGACASVEPIASEPSPDVSQESVPESVSANDADAAEIATEPVAEMEPEPQPEPVPEAVCANGTTRSCYPAGKNGCSVDSGGKFVCKGICAVGTESCVDGDWSGKCSGATEPATELCNSKDDDCDGQVDNGFANLGQPCEAGKGECKATGKFVCKTDGSGTECDAKPGTPKVETCDGKDNDCNGKIDEDPNNDTKKLTRPCYTGPANTRGKGLCRDGTQSCVGGTWEQACNGEVKPSTEICGDGKDNDCNGEIDEKAAGCQCNPGEKQACGSSDVGECKKGTQTCNTQGQWDACIGEVKSRTELCNGKDDDCNGTIDNGFANLGQPCDMGQGECKATGKYVCKADGSGTVCDAKPGQAITETCNNKDDDCNGKIDDGIPNCTQHCQSKSDCPAAFPDCQAGQCIRFCKTSADCDDTYWCQQGFCQTCPNGTKQSDTEICDGKDNNCNGVIDESFPEYQKACTIPNQQGECAKGIYTACNQGKLVCTGPSAQAETCNGKDDDCDGQIDNRCGFFWAVSAGGTGNDYGSSITIDNSGDLYVFGGYTGMAIFGSTTLNSSGYGDIFVAKFNNQGVFQRVVSSYALSSGHAQAVESVSDVSGNLYIIGNYQGEVLFNNTKLTSHGTYAAFVAKLSSQGTFLWATSVGGGSGGRSIVADGSGNLYITGYYNGTAILGSTTLSSSGAYSVFVAKLDDKGTFLWASSAGGTGNYKSGNSIASDSSGNLYITGQYDGIVSFGSATLTSQGTYNTFVTKLSGQGTFVWAVSVGGSDNTGNSIISDSSNNLYMIGAFYGTATFGSTTLTSKGGGSDIFVAKLNNQGTFLWISSAGSTGGVTGTNITADSVGNLYVTGYYSKTATFGSTVLISKGGENVFAAKLDNQGTFLWATSAGTTSTYGRAVTIDGSGNLYLTGQYSGTAAFGSITLTSAGINDIFVAKFR